jgi:hypothetical protein
MAATGASRTPATGGRSGSGPAAASEKEHPLHVTQLTAPARVFETPRSVCRRNDLDRDVGVLVGVIARADPVVAVGNLQRDTGCQVSADNQNR